MATETERLREGDREQIREFQPSDFGGSEPALSRGEGIFHETTRIQEGRRVEVPAELRESAREKALSEQISEDYSGEGLVAVNKRTGDIIAIADDLRGLRGIFEEIDVPPEDRLVVSCYER